MVGLYLGESWEVHTCVTSSHRWCQARGAKDQPHTQTGKHRRTLTLTAAHHSVLCTNWLGVPSWLITFNIFIIYTPPAALQQYIIHLHSAPSALCHKKLWGRSHRGRHAHMSQSGEEHYPHVHTNNLSVTAFCLLLPIPPSLPSSLHLHPRCRAIMPVNWSWRESGTPWHWAANAELLH